MLVGIQSLTYLAGCYKGCRSCTSSKGLGSGLTAHGGGRTKENATGGCQHGDFRVVLGLIQWLGNGERDLFSLLHHAPNAVGHPGFASRVDTLKNNEETFSTSAVIIVLMFYTSSSLVEEKEVFFASCFVAIAFRTTPHRRKMRTGATRLRRTCEVQTIGVF